jgi:putative transposase
MVRAGVVSHPHEWDESGYKEIQQPRQRYTLIDNQCLMELLDIPSMDMLQRSHRGWVEESLRVERGARDSKWSESIAVGSKAFVAKVKKQLGLRAKGRKVTESPDECQLREKQFRYRAISGGESGLLSSHNLHLWEVYLIKSDS